MGPDFLHTPIEFLKGVGPAKSEILKKELNISTFYDLLNHFPFRYIDRSVFYKISDLQENMPFIQIKGILGPFEEVGTGKGKRLTAEFYDKTGSIDLVWFQSQKWIRENYVPGNAYIVFGKPGVFKGRFNIVHPELDVLDKPNVQGGLQAVYPLTEKLKAKNIQNRQLVQMVSHLIHHPSFKMEEIYPPTMVQRLGLINRESAFRQIHMPTSNAERVAAERRLKFDELFALQLRIVRLKLRNKKVYKGIPFIKVGDYFNQYYHQLLPFELTHAQKRVIREIRKDLQTGKQMNRLLQGDVGSGKSIVALLLMLIAADNETQSSLMAPTEILATQHYENMREGIEAIGLKVALLTGSTKQSERKRILAETENGQIHILIGTHALIEDRVKMKRQGLVIIDEQHRFGVAQRAKMWEKSEEVPHILVMTATPIPRTLAMTVYGDLDVSIIDELPVGRKQIKTMVKNEANRMDLFEFIKTQIKQGRQVYVVYPLIEESEKLDYLSLMEGYELFQTFFPRPEYQPDIIHGKMKPSEKDFVMERFKLGQIDILISTTVIEVGINVPNATVMVIENAERFGLSQLHQLRGRVGRGSDQSYCILMCGQKLSADGRARLKAMVSTTDGFKLAELDLKLRGPGNIEGTQQSGLVDLKIASLVDDEELMKLARFEAEQLLNRDPTLSDPAFSGLRRHLTAQGPKTDWSQIA
jgi:ATP-dependent DNA helicase RecG